MSNHTAAPWKFDDHPGCRPIKGGKDGAHKQAQYKEIAWTVGLADDDEDRANAVLLTQAPKLLAALNDIARQHTSTEWDVDADGEPMGDVTEGYDALVLIAREAVK